MFHNVLMTSLTTPLCNTDEINLWENRPFSDAWPESQQRKTKGPEITKAIRKKPKRIRTAYTTDQLRLLENTYCKNKYIDRELRKQLSKCLNINEKSIKVWFQNRRMKEKRISESSDSSSESYTVSSPVDVQQDFTEDPQACQVSSTVKYPKIQITITNNDHETTQNSHASQTETSYASGYVNNNEFPQYNFSQPIHGFDSQYFGNYMQPEALAFCNDSNVYPTQYYPSGNEYNFEQYGQQNNVYPNYCGSMYYP